MNKSVTLILAILILAALIGTLIFTNNKQSQAEVNPSPETTISTESNTDESIPVLNLTVEDITSVTVEIADTSLTYIPGVENWSIQDYEDYDVDQSSLNYKAKTLLTLSGTRKLTATDLSQYGLDNPSKTATYALKDGTTIKLLVGNFTLDQSSIYVMLESDPTTVYITPSIIYNCMESDISKFRNTELETPESESISGIKISGTDFETMNISISSEQNGIVTAYDLTTDTFDHVSVSNSSFDTLVNALPDFTVDIFIADNVTDLSTYGLDHPRLHLIIDFYDPNIALGGNNLPATTTTLDFIWGNELEDGKIAFMRTGESSVYSMDASFLSTFKEVATPFNLSSKFIELPNINDVKAIDVAYADATYHLDVDEANTKYALNNKSIEKDAFKALYRSVIGIYAEIEVDEKSTNTTPEVTITYTMHDGSTQVATFMEATSNQYYQTVLNGSMIVGCSKTQLSNLKTTLDEALSSN